MIFVDTGAWFAAVVPNDPSHGDVISVMEHYVDELVTTDYVLDETITLLARRGEAERAIRLGRRLLEEKVARLEWVNAPDAARALIIFERHARNGWSFTDCTSLVVMQRLAIEEAVALDHHFKQFGGITVVP